jgi:demethylmenaquinone methyltransferase/2-methoxy-6-polyprenyl-1,4-benzoquinol methylase
MSPAYLAPGHRVLDPAVGTGLAARAAHNSLGGGDGVAGVALSMSMLAEVRKNLPITLVQGVAERLPVADACVDFVTMGYALRHVFIPPRQDVMRRVFNEYVATEPRN